MPSTGEVQSGQGVLQEPVLAFIGQMMSIGHRLCATKYPNATNLEILRNGSCSLVHSKRLWRRVGWAWSLFVLPLGG